MRNVMGDLKQLENGVGQIVQKFAGETPGYNWKMKDGDLPMYTYGSTTTDYQNNTVTTTFDSDKFDNATNLSVSRTILHEVVHGYLVAYFHSNPNEATKTYQELLEDYYKSLDSNYAHHQEMARSFVGGIGKSLKEFGLKKGYDLPDQFYNDLAWGGLFQTSYFKAKSPAEKNRIKDVVLTELTGKDKNGESNSQKGEKSGC